MTNYEIKDVHTCISVDNTFFVYIELEKVVR